MRLSFSRSGRSMQFSSLLLVGGMALAAVGTQVGPGVSAFFTDTANLNTNTFTAGTLDIKLNGSDSVTGAFAVSGMAPGDTSTQTVAVTNPGSLALRYAISAGTVTDALAMKDILVLRIKTLGASCAAFDGTTLYDSSVGSEGIDGPASFKLVGDAAQGAQTGDRPLAGAGGAESLCFRIELPITAPNSVQGGTANAQWVFSAEQTSNNP